MINASTQPRKFTGKHMIAVMVLFFGTIITVNMIMAWHATNSWTGLVVKNSYVASQGFDDRRAEQEALGWTVRAEAKGGLLILSIKDADGKPVQAGSIDAVLGRATHVQDDRSPDFTFDGKAYVARESLRPGNWNIRMTAVALDGSKFEQRVVLHVES